MSLALNKRVSTAALALSLSFGVASPAIASAQEEPKAPAVNNATSPEDPYSAAHNHKYEGQDKKDKAQEQDLKAQMKLNMAKRGNVRNAISELKTKLLGIAPKVHTPTSGELTSNFGPRWGTFHAGIDIANSVGTPLYAVTDGVVINAGPVSGYGNWVRIKNDDGEIFTYGHISEWKVSEGQEVKAGDEVALMGSAGFSTGSHLHFGVEIGEGNFVDPLSWLIEHGVNDWANYEGVNVNEQ